jgi:hypothetical protein
LGFKCSDVPRILKPIHQGLREEHRLGVFENRVLKRIFGPKRDEVKLHNEELHDLYSSPSIIRIKNARRITWVGHVE